MEDFNWIEETNPITLERGKDYVIDLCGKDYHGTDLEESIKEKFVELFSNKPFTGKWRNELVNWFDNQAMAGQSIYLILRISKKRRSNPFGVSGGWNPCEPEENEWVDEELMDEVYAETIEDYINVYNHEYITGDQFLTARLND
jgi:hypothetical protein